MVGSNPRSNSGWIKSVVKGLARIPSRGWQYTDNGWRSDKTLEFLFDASEEGTEHSTKIDFLIKLDNFRLPRLHNSRKQRKGFQETSEYNGAI